MPKLRKSSVKSRAAPYSLTSSKKTETKDQKDNDCASLYAANILNRLRTAYEKSANADYAVRMKKYLRNQFDFFGIQSPERKAIGDQVRLEYNNPSAEELQAVLLLLWDQKQREYKYFGMEYARKHLQVLVGVGPGVLQGTVKSLITKDSWWDTVDCLACHVVGAVVNKYRSDGVEVMDQWIDSEDMWLRRTAILHQLSYKTNTDQERLFKYCMKCCHEKEFFIQKAIGWALREYHKSKPKEVQKFVKKNQNSLAKLSVREALKHA